MATASQQQHHHHLPSLASHASWYYEVTHGPIAERTPDSPSSRRGTVDTDVARPSSSGLSITGRARTIFDNTVIKPADNPQQFGPLPPLPPLPPTPPPPPPQLKCSVMDLLEKHARPRMIQKAAIRSDAPATAAVPLASSSSDAEQTTLGRLRTKVLSVFGKGPEPTIATEPEKPLSPADAVFARLSKDELNTLAGSTPFTRPRCDVYSGPTAIRDAFQTINGPRHSAFIHLVHSLRTLTLTDICALLNVPLAGTPQDKRRALDTLVQNYGFTIVACLGPNTRFSLPNIAQLFSLQWLDLLGKDWGIRSYRDFVDADNRVSLASTFGFFDCFSLRALDFDLSRERITPRGNSQRPSPYPVPSPSSRDPRPPFRDATFIGMTVYAKPRLTLADWQSFGLTPAILVQLGVLPATMGHMGSRTDPPRLMTTGDLLLDLAQRLDFDPYELQTFIAPDITLVDHAWPPMPPPPTSPAIPVPRRGGGGSGDTRSSGLKLNTLRRSSSSRRHRSRKHHIQYSSSEEEDDDDDSASSSSDSDSSDSSGDSDNDHDDFY